MPSGGRGRAFGRSRCARGRVIHDGVTRRGSRRHARRSRSSGDGGVGLRRGSRRRRRRERVRDSSVLNKCCNTSRELHDRLRGFRLRLCDRSEGALDAVHTRDRLGETFELRGRRRGGKRDRVSVARSARPAGSEGGSRDGLSAPRERVRARGLRPAPADDRREVATGLDSAPEVGRRGVSDFGARDYMSMSSVPTSVPHSKLTSTMMSSTE